MATQLSDAELQSILDFTIGLARRAGEVMLEGSEKIRESGATDEKKNSVDLVTEYDVKVEQLVIGELKVAYPSYHLCVPSLYLACQDTHTSFSSIGEETFAAGGYKRPEMTDEPTFCVDPIGTYCSTALPHKSHSPLAQTARRTSCTASRTHASRWASS